MSWSLDDEIKLFSGLMTFKPVGLDRNFQMICLAHRLQVEDFLNYSVSNIWKRLGELYNLEELNDAEVIPYPNEQSDFSLHDDFNELKSLPFRRTVSLNVNSTTPSNEGSSSRHKHKLTNDFSNKPNLPVEENPPATAASSPSISPHSISSPSSVPNTSGPVSNKRTRKSIRANTEKDIEMPPPVSSTASHSHAPRKSTRRQH